MRLKCSPEDCAVRAKRSCLPLNKTLRALIILMQVFLSLYARRSTLVRGIIFSTAQGQKAEVGRQNAFQRRSLTERSRAINASRSSALS